MGLTSFISLVKYPTPNHFSMAQKLKQGTSVEKSISLPSLQEYKVERIQERRLKVWQWVFFFSISCYWILEYIMKPRPTVQSAINKVLLLCYHVWFEPSHCPVSNLLHVSAVLFTHAHMLSARWMVPGPGARETKGKPSSLLWILKADDI